MRPLEEIQREFFAAVRMPLRGTSRRSTELPPSNEGHAPEFLAKAEELMKSGSNLSSAERLELYHRQYWFRLLESIAEDFPLLRRMAGEETFWSLMEAYLVGYPSGSFTLRHLGSRMGEFIAGFDRISDKSRTWFSAIARLEYAYMEIYEAAEWKPVPAEQLMTAELTLQPHVVLLDLPVPADQCAGWEMFSPGDESPVHLAVWRGDAGGRAQCRLDSLEFEILARLRRGGRLESLFADPAEREPLPEEVSQWFADWQSRKWITFKPDGNNQTLLAPVRRREQDLDWSGVDKMGSQARAMED